MDIENLIDKLNDAIEAKMEERIARNRYTGFDWGYHGFEWTERCRVANEKFSEALNDYIHDVLNNHLKFLADTK